MKPKGFEANIEVSGECIGAILDGFKQYPGVAVKVLARFGLIKSEAMKPSDIDRAAWYPMEAWLAAHNVIADEVGANSMYAVGRRIPQNGPIPPNVKDIHDAIPALDVAYHLAHRKSGIVMFNPETGEMLEGIGHYRYEPRGERTVACIAENPYPCDFDRGLVSAMTQRFEEFSQTVHDDTSACRKKGGESCTYIVTW
jgi:hypothetical protein